MRADARRNRERIIEAARKVFAEYGSDAQMDDVAAAAGVGVGTVYRHFPNKDALIGELVRQKFEKIADGLRAASAMDLDPGEALLVALERNAEQLEDDLATQHVMSGGPHPAIWQMCAANVTEVNELATKLIAGGIASGTLRPDMVVTDIRLLMGGITSTMADPATRPMWRRHLQLMLDALRAPRAV
ncbi:MAG: TetR/AcrR family transcriptional regulator [Solirubrobacteraceae bacterium]|nr:TetR/AcrR family transcriptional regulator [Solirubrobacteraceae bacterium]